MVVQIYLDNIFEKSFKNILFSIQSLQGEAIFEGQLEEKIILKCLSAGINFLLLYANRDELSSSV